VFYLPEAKRKEMKREKNVFIRRNPINNKLLQTRKKKLNQPNLFDERKKNENFT
jgi:hypothetical protein